MNALDNQDNLNENFLKWKCKLGHGKMCCGQSDETFNVLINDVDLNRCDDKTNLIVSLTNKDSVENRHRNLGKVGESIIQFSIHRIQSDIAYLIDRTGKNIFIDKVNSMHIEIR